MTETLNLRWQIAALPKGVPTLGCINRKGRVVTCGLISQYNAETPSHNLSNLSRFLIQRARMQAFIVVDYLPRAAEALPHLTE